MEQMAYTPEEIKEALAMFTGTMGYHRYLIGTVLTDGAKFLAESARCYWLLDLIASWQTSQRVRSEYFQAWTLRVRVTDGRRQALASCDDGNGNILARQDIECTDFPLDEITLYFIDGVILLPGEY